MSLYKFDRTLAETSTPDWVLYCRAAEAGFDALVTRDQSQISQPVEMYVLSRLHHFTIVTWKKSVEDPIREWGQLLAYLPDEKILINADLYSPPAANAPLPKVSDGARQLADNIKRLKLDVDRHVGIHGDVGSHQQFLTVVGVR